MIDKNSLRSVVLTITNRCNLSCTYCYETHKDNTDMSFDTAIDIINREIDSDCDRPIEFNFHGGDPFMNFSLMKEICEYAWAKSTDKGFRFCACTNGSILTQEMESWLIENKDRISIGISMDGTPKMNYVNRGYRFTSDRLKFFKDNYPDQVIKLTVSPQSIGNIAEGVIWIHEQGLNLLMSIAQGIEWDVALADIYAIELIKVADYYIENPEVDVMYNFKRSLSSIVNKEPVKRACAAGKNVVTYDVNGNKYPCQVFITKSFKDDIWKIVEDIDFNNDSLFCCNECSTCLIENLCPTCYAMNFIHRGSVSARDMSLCRFLKAEIKALAYYKHKLISSKDLGDITDEENIELTGARIILDKYNQL